MHDVDIDGKVRNLQLRTAKRLDLLRSYKELLSQFDGLREHLILGQCLLEVFPLIHYEVNS